jgi:hypothetical protein
LVIAWHSHKIVYDGPLWLKELRGPLRDSEVVPLALRLALELDSESKISGD